MHLLSGTSYSQEATQSEREETRLLGGDKSLNPFLIGSHLSHCLFLQVLTEESLCCLLPRDPEDHCPVVGKSVHHHAHHYVTHSLHCTLVHWEHYYQPSPASTETWSPLGRVTDLVREQ